MIDGLLSADRAGCLCLDEVCTVMCVQIVQPVLITVSTCIQLEETESHHFNTDNS